MRQGNLGHKQTGTDPKQKQESRKEKLAGRAMKGMLANRRGDLRHVSLGWSAQLKKLFQESKYLILERGDPEPLKRQQRQTL